MDIGMPANFHAKLTSAPVYNPSNTVKITITKTSSTEEAATTKVGIPLSVPRFFAAKSSIIGTTTAGDTAASTIPKMADSR